MATKNIDTVSVSVSGLVEQINAKQTCIKVAGEWVNQPVPPIGRAA